MTPLFLQIESSIPTMMGWCSYRKAHHLAALVIARQSRLSVELGVFGGRGLLAMALAHKHIGKGMAIGVDPWTTEAATEGYTGENKTWWSSLNMEKIYQGCLQHVDALGCRNVVKIERKKSLDFEPPMSIDVLHLDSQHTDATSAEVNKFATWVSLGGFVVLDDMTWLNDGKACVPVAADWLMNHGFIELCRVFREVAGEDKDDYAVYQKISAKETPFQ